MKNGIMMQYFEWYLPNDGSLWRQLAEDAPALAEKGVTSVWIPPAYKASSADDVGYGTYDLFDLGEFDQKGTVRTKYGTKDELFSAIKPLHECGIQVYGDVVLNHKAGADFTECFKVVPVDPENRQQIIGEERDIEGWTGFNFPGRDDRKRSDFVWHWQHFTGVDHDDITGENAIFRIVGGGKEWSDRVSGEMGNFDYLMFADIDHNEADVRQELFHWGKWFVEYADLDGFRLDAAKHIDSAFMRDFVKTMKEKFGESFYVVAEYWDGDPAKSHTYLEETEYKIDLFDVPLHFNFMQAGRDGSAYDLRKIFDGSLVSAYPLQAVTFVDNHDSQPGQSLESFVTENFKQLAYALILLRKDGYPCIFYGDYYGTEGPDPFPDHREVLDKLCLIRRRYSAGAQIDYFDREEVIGWVRTGSADEERDPLIVVMTNKEEDQLLDVEVGQDYAGTVFADFLGNHDGKITVGDDGWVGLPVRAGNVSCWLPDGIPLEDIQEDEIEEIE